MRTKLSCRPPGQQNSRPAAALASTMLMVGFVLGPAQFAAADSPLSLLPKRDPFGATTAKSARLSALQSIPVEQLDDDAREKVKSVLANVSVFRRLPIRVTDCDPDLYLFLVEHPDVTVNIWQVLEITKLQLSHLEDDIYQVSEPNGTVAVTEFLHKSPDLHLIYGEGTYEGPLFAQPVKGRCLMVLKTGYVRETDGRYYITTRLDTFLNVEHAGADLLTRLCHPLVGRTADLNFVQSLSFLGSLSRTAETNSRGVRRLASKLEDVRPQLRERLSELAAEIAEQPTIPIDTSTAGH